MKKRVSVALGVVAVVVALVAFTGAAATQPACAESPSATSGSAGDEPVVLHIGWNQKVDSLNPFVGYESVSYALYHLNYDYLTATDPETLQPVPSLAESWTSSEDSRKWTFKLRDDVVWQDGEPLTSADVVYSIKLNLREEIGNYDAYVTGIISCTATDATTVEIVCQDPLPRILTNFTLVPIVPKHIWSKMSIAEITRKFQNTPPVIGSGPFQIVEFKRDKYVRLKANPSFWGEKPRVDEIVFQMYTNNDTLAADLRSGVIQGGNVQAASYTSLKDTPGLTTNLALDNGFDELGFNCYDSTSSEGNPVCRDAAFRHALGWAIDRDKIAAIAWDGFAKAATTIIPEGYYAESLDYHWDPPTDLAYSFDPEKCEQLLDEAGYSDTNGDGIREDKSGDPIKLRLWAASDKPEYALAAKFITGWLEDVGLQIDMQVMEDGALSDRQYNYKGSTFAPDFDLFIWGWSTGEYDPNFLLSLFTTSQIEAWSDCNYSNSEYDELYAEQDEESDDQARKAAVDKMQEIVYEESPYIPLVYPEGREVYSTAWEGWTKEPAANGSVWNRYTYLRLQPVGEATAESTGSSTVGVVIGVVVAVAAVIAIIVVVLRRRASQAEVETD